MDGADRRYLAIPQGMFSRMHAPKLRSLSIQFSYISKWHLGHTLTGYLLATLPPSVAIGLEKVEVEGFSTLTRPPPVPVPRLPSLRRLRVEGTDSIRQAFDQMIFPISLSSPNPAGEMAKPLTLRELLITKAASSFLVSHFRRMLTSNDLGSHLTLLSIRTSWIMKCPSFTELPLVVTELCPNLKTLEYFHPCPESFLQDIPITLQRLGLLLIHPKDTESMPTALSSVFPLVDWMKDATLRKNVKVLMIDWVQKFAEEDKQEELEIFGSGISIVRNTNRRRLGSRKVPVMTNDLVLVPLMNTLCNEDVALPPQKDREKIVHSSSGVGYGVRDKSTVEQADWTWEALSSCGRSAETGPLVFNSNCGEELQSFRPPP
ncbi:hypothetical protein BDN72DRAFT_884242 [Pluteus cervinus]|uniref:Uncharacterized protein n=1 Tax=Pluteus cervinus TaxID=181527 RepID=A0ACD2ZYC3_9AGAR|nr:hypothetical protein BDN72DRAFT_884242 [Pluteus cervinus]